MAELAEKVKFVKEGEGKEEKFFFLCDCGKKVAGKNGSSPGFKDPKTDWLRTVFSFACPCGKKDERTRERLLNAVERMLENSFGERWECDNDGEITKKAFAEMACTPHPLLRWPERP